MVVWLCFTVLLASGIFALVKPRRYWDATRYSRSWMYSDSEEDREPSGFFLAITQFSGLVLILAALGIWAMQTTHQNEQRAKEEAASIQSQINSYSRVNWGATSPGRIFTSAHLPDTVEAEDRALDRVLGYAVVDDEARFVLSNSQWYSARRTSPEPIQREQIETQDLILGIDIKSCMVSGLQITETAEQVVIDIGFIEKPPMWEGAEVDPKECQSSSVGLGNPDFMPLDLQAPLGQREVVFPNGKPIKVID